ncbi:MAG: hypothetical protein HY738_19380, partial [Bacteroidia bacterium]|nr:hypothetical protein [Bacteroidia bacterium]
MKTITTISIVVFLCLNAVLIQAQNIAISDDDGYIAHPSAMLDIKSTTKGMLVPRVSTAQRTAINNPETGLLVFDTDAGSFYFFKAGTWVNLTYGNPGGIWGLSGSNVFLTNTSHQLGIGTTAPVGKLEVKGDVPVSSQAPLFEVINSAGDTVFAVYSQGVRVYVADDIAIKASGSRSGFAVGGFSITKGITNEYLRVTPDSVRIYIEDTSAVKASGSRGGFAVGGFSQTKGITNDLLTIDIDSTRVYVNDSTAGFGIASTQGGARNDFMKLTTRNYFIGHQSGDSITRGTFGGKHNCVFGYQSGKSLKNGESNCFMGYRTGYLTSSGSRNVFIGTETGLKTGTGSENVFIGYQCGTKNTNGIKNIFLGYSAGFNNIGGDIMAEEGSFNTFIGNEAGNQNTTGGSNTFIGYQSGYQNKTGIHNTYIGRWTGQNNDGSYNVFIGTEAGRYVVNDSYRLHIDARNGAAYVAPLIYGEFDGFPNKRIVVIDGDATNNFNNRTLFVKGD